MINNVSLTTVANIGLRRWAGASHAYPPQREAIRQAARVCEPTLTSSPASPSGAKLPRWEMPHEVTSPEDHRLVRKSGQTQMQLSKRVTGYTANAASSADSTSTSTPAVGMIERARISLPARHSAMALCLDSPLTKNITCRARLSRAALIDTRCGGGLGMSNRASVSGDPGAAPHS